MHLSNAWPTTLSKKTLVTMLLVLFWLFLNFKFDYLAYFYELRDSDFGDRPSLA